MSLMVLKMNHEFCSCHCDTSKGRLADILARRPSMNNVGRFSVRKGKSTSHLLVRYALKPCNCWSFDGSVYISRHGNRHILTVCGQRVGVSNNEVCTVGMEAIVKDEKDIHAVLFRLNDLSRLPS